MGRITYTYHHSIYPSSSSEDEFPVDGKPKRISKKEFLRKYRPEKKKKRNHKDKKRKSMHSRKKTRWSDFSKRHKKSKREDDSSSSDDSDSSSSSSDSDSSDEESDTEDKIQIFSSKNQLSDPCGKSTDITDAVTDLMAPATQTNQQELYTVMYNIQDILRTKHNITGAQRWYWQLRHFRQRKPTSTKRRAYAIFNLFGAITTFPAYTDQTGFGVAKWRYRNVLQDLERLSKDYQILILLDYSYVKALMQEKYCFYYVDYQALAYLLRIVDNFQFPCLFRIICNGRTSQPPAMTLNGLQREFPKWDWKNSFYCGADAGRKQDKTDVDRKRAINAEIKFYTPQDLFKREAKLNRHGKRYVKEESYKLNYPKLKGLIMSAKSAREYYRKEIWSKAKLDEKIPTMHIMTSYRGGGVSDYVQHIFKSEKDDPFTYAIIEPNSLGVTKPKRIKALKELIAKHKKGNKKVHIVVNANLSHHTHRNVWIKLAKELDYSSVCHHLTTTEEICRHNIYYSSFTKNADAVGDLNILRFETAAPITAQIRDKSGSIKSVTRPNFYYTTPTEKEKFKTLLKVPFRMMYEKNISELKNYFKCFF
jgi:hypothetical protein